MTLYDIIIEFEQVCVRLYESEESDDFESVGDAYISLSRMVRELYPGLSLSLLRTGEVIMQDKGCIDKLIILRLDLVDAYLKLSNSCYSNKDAKRGGAFYVAAIEMNDIITAYINECGITKYDAILHEKESVIKYFTNNECQGHIKDRTIHSKKEKTILDIIEGIAIEEELYSVDQKSQNESFMPTGHYAENRYMPMSYSLKERDKVILVPMGIIMGRLYRGEARYHKICKASLYRVGMLPSEIFWERLKTCQLSCLIYNYPITRVFEGGLKMKDSKFPIDHLHIDYEAIAQHYGIKTSLIDLTIDKWVAAFFATSRLDRSTGCYYPVKKSRKKGAFYQLDTDFMHTFGKEVRSIGVQPLARPEYQNGYVYRMGRHSELNRDRQMKRTMFVHDYYQNRLIFAYANRGNRFFPKELAEDRIDEIVKTRKIHPDAYKYVVSKFYKTTPQSVIDKYLVEQKIEIVDDIPHFSNEEIENIFTVWEHHDAYRILRRILKPVLFYKM